MNSLLPTKNLERIEHCLGSTSFYILNFLCFKMCVCVCVCVFYVVLLLLLCIFVFTAIAVVLHLFLGTYVLRHVRPFEYNSVTVRLISLKFCTKLQLHNVENIVFMFLRKFTPPYRGKRVAISLKLAKQTHFDS